MGGVIVGCISFLLSIAGPITFFSSELEMCMQQAGGDTHRKVLVFMWLPIALASSVLMINATVRTWDAIDFF